MKVALVHDWLNQKVGGAESVLFELANMYPEADIYTLVYNKQNFSPYLANREIITSRLQHRPGFMKRRPALMLGGIKKAVEHWDFSGYDVVISSSTAWVKNITVPEGVRHICYCHSPGRMMWDSWPKYLDTVKLGPFTLGHLGKLLVGRKVSKLRLWDYYQSKQVTTFVANSHYIAKRIKKYYHRDSQVIHPPVEVMRYKPSSEVHKSDYFLILSVLSRYKNIDLAIAAFKKLDDRLIIAGSGPDMTRLKELAGTSSNIEFVDRVDEDRKTELLQHAKGFIFCSVEDFGITMVEALAAETGLIALNAGGAREILKDQKTGYFFSSPTSEALIKTLEQYKQHRFDPKDFSYVYKTFDPEQFRSKIREVVGQ